MAFNPFHSFRKHQKVLFAILTIIVMFVFVLQFGPGDPFERLASFFGSGKGSHGEVVATLYGNKVTERDLELLREQRQMANVFMAQAVMDGHRATLREVEEALSRFPTGDRTSLELILGPLRRAVEHPDPSKAKSQEDWNLQYGLWQMSRRDYLPLVPQHLQTLKQVLEHNPNEAELIRKLAMLILQQEWLITPGGKELYFGGSIVTDDLLDFLVWKHQADQMGVSLNDSDLRLEINNQALSRDLLVGDAQRDLTLISNFLNRAGYREVSGIPLDRIYPALRDELRVQIAQSALLGRPSGVLGRLDSVLGINEVPAMVTPDQFYNYVRDNRTTLKVSLLPIPVKKFLTAAAEAPDPAKLQELFELHKDREPNPDSDQPGFRMPRRVQVQWVSAQADSPHYQKVAQERAVAAAASLAGNPWLALGFVEQLQDEYHPYRFPTWNDPPFITQPFYIHASLARPANVAAMVGEAMAAGVQGLPLTALVRSRASVAAQEAKLIAPQVGALVLAGAQWPLPAALNTMAVLYDHGNRSDRYLPLGAVAGLLMEKLQEDMAQAALRDNLTKLRDQLKAWKNKSPEDGAKELAKVVADYGFKHGATAGPRDQFQIEDDEGLKPLKETIKVNVEEHARAQRNPNPPKFQLAPFFFPKDTERYTPGEVRTRRTGEVFTFWKTDDKEGQAFSSYDRAPTEVQEWVKDAWHMLKARELARREIDKLQAKARAFTNADEVVRFLRDEGKKHGWEPVFTLDRIAPLVAPKSPFVGVPRDYEPYKPPEDKINARPDFAERLLRLLKKPGDVTVVWNKPESVYYVVVLDERDEPGIKEFYDVYRKVAPDDILTQKDTLMGRLESEQRRDYYLAAMKELRAEAQGDGKGEWVIDTNLRKRMDDRNRESD